MRRARLTEVGVVAAHSMGSIQTELPVKLLNKAGGGAGDEIPGPPNVYCVFINAIIFWVVNNFLSESAGMGFTKLL